MDAKLDKNARTQKTRTEEKKNPRQKRANFRPSSPTNTPNTPGKKLQERSKMGLKPSAFDKKTAVTRQQVKDPFPSPALDVLRGPLRKEAFRTLLSRHLIPDLAGIALDYLLVLMFVRIIHLALCVILVARFEGLVVYGGCAIDFFAKKQNNICM